VGPVLSRTWLTTVLIVAAAGLLVARSHDTIWIATVLGSGLVIVPSLWWWLIGQRPAPGVRRGVLAGALGGGCTFVVAMMVMTAWVKLQGGSDPGLGAIGNALFVVTALGNAVIAAMVGAVLGATVVEVGRRRMSGREARTRSQSLNCTPATLGPLRRCTVGDGASRPGGRAGPVRGSSTSPCRPRSRRDAEQPPAATPAPPRSPLSPSASLSRPRSGTRPSRNRPAPSARA